MQVTTAMFSINKYYRFIRQFPFFVSLNNEKYKHPQITCTDQGNELRKKLNIKIN